MARRSGGTHKGVEDRRRNLPIYQHYTLSPGKTKSHHPEAKCNHCLKEFVCGSKQRLIRHLRKCNSISNPDQIIAETLNTLARNSATGTLNHSILEASNLLPSQISPILQHSSNQQQQSRQQHHHHNQNHNQHHHHSASTTTTANNNTSNNNNNVNSNHNNSGPGYNDLVASSSNGSNHHHLDHAIAATPSRRGGRRGRRPASQAHSNISGIHVTTGIDGTTHFTPASQLPPTISGTATTPMIAQVHNGGQSVGYTTFGTAVSSTASPIAAVPGAHLSSNSGHLACGTPNHHPTPFQKLNSDSIEKAYLKLVLTRNLPLSLCDTKEFQVWVKLFANDYKPPSSINLIAQNLKNEAQAARQRISNILVKVPKKTINLELHTWPDQMRDHIWYAVVATVEHKRFLISVKDIHIHNETGNNNDPTQPDSEHALGSSKLLTEFIDDCIKRVGSDRINSLVFSARVRDDATTAVARESLYLKHPSIVTYHCWWHFTNLLCSDVIELNEVFQAVMRNSNRLIDFINKRPRFNQLLEKFSPFAGISGSVCPKKDDRRWYSHLVCYLLEYIRNNHESIVAGLDTYTTSATQSHLSSDNNNNNNNHTSSSNNDDGQQQPEHVGNVHHEPSTQQHHQAQQDQLAQVHDPLLVEFRSIVASADYWANLNSLLTYLKPLHDIVALTSIFFQPSQHNSINPAEPYVQTPSACPTLAGNLSMSDYMNWFLNYGKVLFDGWRQEPDFYKHQLIGSFLSRFYSLTRKFHLPIAAYLLNPKHRCAFMTQTAKNAAIEEILNIASEFMPEESDGHTIFDQWKLYLIREEPYDMVFDETKSTPLEWWTSLPCAESIRRVALRILRLKAFTTPTPNQMFSQLYFYENETKFVIDKGTFEDIAVMRYFYDYEDKVGQFPANHSYTSMSNTTSNSVTTNGFHDRSQVGQAHQEEFQQSNDPARYLPTSGDMVKETNGDEINDSMTSDGVVGRYAETFYEISHHSLTIENLPGYENFMSYVDYNDIGVQIVEEPIEKKRRKWTAQEILSKCQQSTHPSNANTATTNNN